LLAPRISRPDLPPHLVQDVSTLFAGPKVAAAGHEIPLRDILCRLIVSTTCRGGRSDVPGRGRRVTTSLPSVPSRNNRSVSIHAFPVDAVVRDHASRCEHPRREDEP
jgi:hypothetical protein